MWVWFDLWCAIRHWQNYKDIAHVVLITKMANDYLSNSKKNKEWLGRSKRMIDSNKREYTFAQTFQRVHMLCGCTTGLWY